MLKHQTFLGKGRAKTESSRAGGPNAMESIRRKTIRRQALRPTALGILFLCLLLVSVGSVHAQTNLTNGGNHDGNILAFETNTWTFTASAGDNVVLRVGRVAGSSNFDPWMRLFDGGGVLIGDTGSSLNATVTEIALTLTNSSTFTVLISDSSSGGIDDAGDYRLRYFNLSDPWVVADDGGALTNGGNHAGTILIGDLDAWTLTANAGDNIVLRSASFNGDLNFRLWLRLYDSGGVLVADTGSANSDRVTEIALTITNSGAFTVLVGDSSFSNFDEMGDYRLYLAQFPGAFVISDDGGALTNGGSHAGTIELGDLDFWTFTADAGDSIVLRSASFNGDLNFRLWLRVYDSSGVLIADTGSANSDRVTEIALTMTNSGTFTVLLGDSTFAKLDDTGDYRLYLARFPGAFVISDDGGALTNGGNHDGTIDLGDLDFWTFTADAGDTLVLRSASFNGDLNFKLWLRIYDSSGVMIANNGSANSGKVTEIALTMTNSGAFTVLVGDSSFANLDDTGDYRLYLAQFPGAFVISDDGGSLTNGVQHTGTINLGDLDLWSFRVCRASFVTLTCDKLTGDLNFKPHLRLYGADGALAATAQDATLAAIIFQPTNSGSFTLLVDDGDPDNTGTYRLTGTGLVEDGLRLCNPLVVSETILDIAAVGGSPGTNGVLYTTINLTPPVVWDPIVTNQFDPMGLFQYTDTFNPGEPQRYFYLEEQ